MVTGERSSALYVCAVMALIGTVFTTAAGISYSETERCELKTNSSRLWSFALTRFRNESGHWVEFTSTREVGDESAVRLTEQLFECDGKKMVRLQGSLRDPFLDEVFDDQLKFHHMTGPNTALINKGYTVVKLKLDGNGPVLTNRPLKSGELFEVRLDKKGTAKGYASGIGVTTHKPEDGGLPEHMNTLNSGTWMLYGIHININGVAAFREYTKSNIYLLKPGERMGVMRSDTGALHFFVNGVDQGPAASNIPEEVYGVYELHGDAIQATILNPARQRHHNICDAVFLIQIH